MKRRLGLLPQHQRPSLATCNGMGTFGALRKMDSLDMVMLCVQRLRNSPYYLLYDK